MLRAQQNPVCPPVDNSAIGVITLTPKQNVAWLEHLERPELRRYLFYGGARSGKTDVILAWLCVQAAKYPGARILMARRTRIAAKSLFILVSAVPVVLPFRYV